MSAFAPAVPLCRAAALAASFAVEPGSAGAGNIVYRLRLVNRSARACALDGIPTLRLVRAQGPLPTHVIAPLRVRLTLRPRKAATATARFSPDVPGVGEPASGRACEPTATRLRITAPGGGTLSVAIRPATAVCEHGTLSFRAFG